MLKVVALLAALPQVLGTIRCGGRHEDPPFWCGDGVVNPGEACDDGAANSDTLPGACRIDCRPARCGDGVIDPGEECDPPAAPGCSIECQISAYCGDGIVDPWEPCDDGNSQDGDGCSAACRSETCGDGVRDPWEACDDGNLRSHDGCSSGCTPETLGWLYDIATFPGRQLHAATWDASRLRLVVFGGADGTGLLDDVLEADGSAFTQHLPQPRPVARAGAALAFHPDLGGALLFGGMDASNHALGDEWLWDGIAWHPLASLTPPPPRAGAVMVYDESQDHLVLHGGLDATWLGDTWERKESGWFEALPGPAPPPRQSAAAVYDAYRGAVLLFGGHAGAWLDDTWVRDASGWREVVLAEAPPAVEDVGLFHHRPTGASYLVGHTATGVLGIWRFAGDRWEAVAPSDLGAGPPPARRAFVLGSLPHRERVLVLGGRYLSELLAVDVMNLTHAGHWPDELCATGEDYDEDGLVDCDDPDCAYEPPCQ